MNKRKLNSMKFDEEKSSEGLVLHKYFVWDKSVRWFHWINVLCIIGLMCLGTLILNANSIDVSDEGKVKLKILHVWVGYAFTLNLLYRFFWGFVGSHHSRWRTLLSFGAKYRASLSSYVRGLISGKLLSYRGHNPLGRLMVLLLFCFLFTQMVTGLVLAGTDLFYPPFGHEFAEWATAAGEDHSKIEGLVPGDKEMLDPDGYAAMREFRAPFIATHKFVFITLLLAIAMHIAAVVLGETREGGGLISAMFTRSKVFGKRPED
jgi:Ni/Fe-hydrogenase 1 B-type cytochrome subunit